MALRVKLLLGELSLLSSRLLTHASRDKCLLRVQWVDRTLLTLDLTIHLGTRGLRLDDCGVQRCSRISPVLAGC